MTTQTHTMAGLAGPRRCRASRAPCTGVPCRHRLPARASPALAIEATYGHHQSSTWTVGAIAKPATFMVFDRKNRPTRQLSELSP